jgi:membrane protein
VLNWLKKHLWPHFWGTLNEWQRDDALQMAAALAFYTAFSFFPLILVLLSIAGLVMEYMQFGIKVENFDFVDVVKTHGSDQLAKQLDAVLKIVSDQLSQVKSNAVVGGPLGFLILLFGAIGIFANMELAFAKMWKEYRPDTPPGVWSMIKRVLFGRLKGFLVVIGLGIFIIATFISNLVVSSLIKYFSEEWALADLPWHWFQFGVGVLLNNTFFLFIYRFFSPRVASWTDCMRGSIVASVFWELGRVLLTQYLVRGTYTPYGVIGSFIAIMLWFYYAWSVLFFGGEYTQVACRIRLDKLRKLPPEDSLTEALSCAQL